MRGGVTADARELIDRSRRAYRRAHRRYERSHPEIFNPVEQARLRAALRRALEEARTGRAPPLALDLGCGSGNVTAHLVELGARVLAGDVVPEFLREVERRFAGDPRVSTVELNGIDLAGIEDAALDLVACYSVLHHVPDYERMLEDAARALRPGGVLYLDHEATEDWWDADSCVHAFRRELWARRQPLTRFLDPRRYAARARRLVDPGYPWNVEGDIHVWQWDHVEWDRVRAALARAGLEEVLSEDYLNFNPAYPRDLWERYRERCGDMRLLVARKR